MAGRSVSSVAARASAESGSMPASIAAKLSFRSRHAPLRRCHRGARCLARYRAWRNRVPARTVRLRQDHAAAARRRRRATRRRPHPDQRPRGFGGPAFLPPERRDVGLMFQDFALFPHLTNLANVMFGLKSLPKARGRARGDARARPGRPRPLRRVLSAHAVGRRAAARGAGARGGAAAERAADGRAVLRSGSQAARRSARRHAERAARSRASPASSSPTIRKRHCAWATASR